MTEFCENSEMELSAGQMLRQARTTGRRKRELATVARTLCIREEFLDALENDEFNRIPELVYILGFARNYAIELELDPNVITEKIKKQMGLIQEIDAIEVEGESNMTDVENASRPVHIGPSFWHKNAKSLFVTFILMILISISGLIIMNSSDTTVTPSPQVVEISNRSLNLPTRLEYGLANRDYSNITLQASGTTWIQVKNANGTVVFEHSMTEGDVYYALSGTTATIGNAGALDIWVNGREIPKIGQSGQRLLDFKLDANTLTAR